MSTKSVGAAFDGGRVRSLILKPFLISILFGILASASSEAATTINTASCLQPVVQAAVTLAAVGDTVAIPAGNCTWTSPVTISRGVTLQGAGQDITVIRAAGTDLLVINGNGTAFRLTGIGFTGTNSAYLIQITGRFSGLRLDHLKFTDVTQRSLLVGSADPLQMNRDGPIYGLVDHITYTNTNFAPFAEHYGDSIGAWTSPDNWGTNQAMYLEDSTFTWNPGAAQPNANMGVWDTEGGARVVARHNTITNGFLSSHDTGAIIPRGTRAREAYANTFICGGNYSGFDCGNSPMSFRGGSLLFYDNIIPICNLGALCASGTKGWESPTELEVWRVDGAPATSTNWPFRCTASQGGSTTNMASDFQPHCSQSPFAACGDPGVTSGTCGTGNTCNAGPQITQVAAPITILTRIDGGSGVNTPGGYPCRDQIGRGQDSADHKTQALLPSYYWNNTEPAVSNNPFGQLNALQNTGGTLIPTYVSANRDVFLTDTVNCAAGSASCTKGVGRGTLAQRPVNCSNADFPGSFPGPAYFATDANTLYQCTATNTWSIYYRPFTYPHPLQGGTAPPATPTGLRLIRP